MASFKWPPEAGGGGGSGTVTSVGLSDSTGLFTITGSPVTTSGTLTLSALASQTQNRFLASPNGSSGAPTFRAIVAADVPTLNQNTTGTAANITATSNTSLTTLSNLASIGTITTGVWNGSAIDIARGGTNITTYATGDIIYASASNVLSKLTAGTNGHVLTLAAGIPSWAAPTGGVTSVALADSTGTFTVTGSPVTGSGTLTLSAYASQSANRFLASPNGGAGAPTFRAIVAADVPTLNQNTTGTASNVTGTVVIANGGTGQTSQAAAITALAGTQVSGQYLRSNGTNTLLAAIQAADVPTLNQNTTGTAANITASSNTSLTSLSNLVTVGTITSGTWNGSVIDIARGGTNNGSLSVSNGTVYYGDGTKLVGLAPGSAGQVLQTNGAGAPSWTANAAPTAYAIFISGLPQSSYTANTAIIWPTVDTEIGSSGAYNTVTGVYTAPVTGNYSVACSAITNGLSDYVSVFVNGTRVAPMIAIASVGGIWGGSTNVRLTAGDLLTVRFNANWSIVGGLATQNGLAIVLY